jgi:hypothetical protein
VSTPLCVIHEAVSEPQARAFLTAYAADPKPQVEDGCKGCDTVLAGKGRELLLITTEGIAACVICKTCEQRLIREAASSQAHTIIIDLDASQVAVGSLFVELGGAQCRAQFNSN